MARPDTHPRADEDPPSFRSPSDTDLLSIVAALARKLNSATTENEAFELALRSMAAAMPCDVVRATVAMGEGRQRLCAAFENGEVTFVDDSEMERVGNGRIAAALESGAPSIFGLTLSEHFNDLLLNSLICADARSVLFAPLSLGDDLLGMLAASTVLPSAFSTLHIDAAAVIANLLASALWRLKISAHVSGAEERESLRQREEALVQRLGSAARSSFDVDQIIQHAIDALARALPASFVVLRTVSFGRPSPVMRAWTPGDDRPPLELHAVPSKEERPVYTEQRTVFIKDARAEGAGGELRPLVERLGARSMRFTPVIYGGQTLAALGLIESDKQRTWTPDEQLMLTRVAETIAPLILNAQLHTRSRAYIEDLLLLMRLAGEVLDGASLDHALRAVIASWGKIAGTDSIAILRWDADAKVFRLAVAEHLPTGLLERYNAGVSLDDPVCGLAASRRAGVVADLAGDRRFETLYAAVRWSGLRGMWATPITGRANQVLGMLLSFSRVAVEVSPEEQRLADLFARPAALAIQNLDSAQKQRSLSHQSRRLEENLRRAEQYKAEFMAIISHELRTPLNAIIGYAHMLIEGFSGELSDGQRVDVQTIAENADRLSIMVEDALDLARMDEHRFPIFMDTVALDEVLRRAVASVTSDADKKGLKIQSGISDDVEPVRTDPERVRQILSNLLSNAVKFTDRGFIRVNVVRDDIGGVRFNVTDTGIGFDSAAFPHIFDDFRQLDASTTRIHGGSGLGLAVSKRLVQRLGGEIGVDSTPGEGSTFWFRLPAEIPGAEV